MALGDARAWARAGYGLILVALLIPAVLDLFTGSLGPPWFVPIVGIGSIILAIANWRDPIWRGWAAYLLLSMGILQIAAVAWFFLPEGHFDSINGYLLYGVTAHVLVGVGWIVLGGYFFWNLKEQHAPAV